MFNYNPDIEKRIIVFLDEYFGRLLMILIYQTLYNYMYLIYFSDTSLKHSYINSIIYEYQLRSQTLCNFQHFADSPQNFITFFSWL